MHQNIPYNDEQPTYECKPCPDFWTGFMTKFMIAEELRLAERQSTAFLDTRLRAIENAI